LYNKKKNDFFKFFLKIFCIFGNKKRKRKTAKSLYFLRKSVIMLKIQILSYEKIFL
jgi:hypothetical protein